MRIVSIPGGERPAKRAQPKDVRTWSLSGTVAGVRDRAAKRPSSDPYSIVLPHGTLESYNDRMQENRPRSWRDWFTFARETLGYEPQEATEYANLRYTEDLNRSARSAPADGSEG